MIVGGVVLAAGRAARMGRPKVLLPLSGRPLLEYVLAALGAAGVAPVVVVTGPDTPDLAPLAIPETVYNAEARQGMGTSIAAGIRALDGRADAAFICLGDQPGIAVATISALLVALRPPFLAAAPIYRGGVRGHPVLFAATLFPNLSGLQGDRGAKGVLEAVPAALVAVDASAPPDVDTPEDYARLLGGASSEDRRA